MVDDSVWCIADCSSNIEDAEDAEDGGVRYARMGARLYVRGRVRGAAATQHCRQCFTLLLQINRLTNIGHIPQVTIIRSPLITSNDDTVQVFQLM